MTLHRGLDGAADDDRVGDRDDGVGWRRRVPGVCHAGREAGGGDSEAGEASDDAELTNSHSAHRSQVRPPNGDD